MCAKSKWWVGGWWVVGGEIKDHSRSCSSFSFSRRSARAELVNKPEVLWEWCIFNSRGHQEIMTQLSTLLLQLLALQGETWDLGTSFPTSAPFNWTELDFNNLIIWIPLGLVLNTRWHFYYWKWSSLHWNCLKDVAIISYNLWKYRSITPKKHKSVKICHYMRI